MINRDTPALAANMTSEPAQDTSSRVFPSKNRRHWLDRAVKRLLISLCALALVPPWAIAVAQPNPPADLCIEGSPDCGRVDTPPTGGIKWHPGHGIKTQGQPCQSDQQGYYNEITSQFSKHLESSDKLTNAYVQYAWGALEHTEGNYDWAPVHAHLDWLEARGKVLIISIQPKCFRTTNTEHIAPDDLEDEVEPTGTGIFVGIWREHVMDRAITFMQAFAAEFDNEPALEAVGWQGENCPSWAGNQPADWSTSAYQAQLKRMYAAQAAAFKQTNLFAPINCNPGGIAASLLEEAYRLGIARRSPDAHDDTGQQLFRGEMDAARDYRGLIAHFVVVSQPNLGGKDDILPLSNIQSAHIDRSGITHASWVLSSGVAGSNKADIITHIENVANGTLQTCPTQYTALFGGCQ